MKVENSEAVLIAALNEIQSRLFWQRSALKGIQSEARKAMEAIDTTEKDLLNTKKIIYVIYDNKAELKRLGEV